MSTTSTGMTDTPVQSSIVGGEQEFQTEPVSRNDLRLQHEDEHPDSRARGSDASGERPKAADQTGYPWVRLLKVVTILIVYFVLEIVVKSLIVSQFLFVAWRKRPHAGIKRWGATIAEYMSQMWRYGTFASDAAPWPFSPWPRGTEPT